MSSFMSKDRLWFLVSRFRERLWVRPLFICLLSIAGAFTAKLADGTGLKEVVPVVTAESIEELLSIMATSMLVIATFAVASMVSAYASASSTATPRTFALVVADDVSQNALSTFIGAFIFSIVSLTSLKNDYFGVAGRFTLFMLTIVVFGIVVFTFVRWVDRIARLGRMATAIDKVEHATSAALERRRLAPTLHGAPVSSVRQRKQPVLAPTVGYVQHVDVEKLQRWAEKTGGGVTVAALPGAFAAPGRVLAWVDKSSDPPADGSAESALDTDPVADAFLIGKERQFDADPRFGFVVMSQIAGRALSPAVNDPGTAIDILAAQVRLFAQWLGPRRVASHDGAGAASDEAPKYDRVEVPELSVHDLFDDAFTAMARDGAGTVEVALRLLKSLHALASLGRADVQAAARRHGRMALARAEASLVLPEDLARVREAARFLAPEERVEGTPGEPDEPDEPEKPEKPEKHRR